MTLATFFDSLRSGRAEWDALLAQIGADRMTQPGVEGDWSIKDIIAHITWHEREMLGVLRARALIGSELWSLPTDERNAAIFEQNKDRALDDVLEESRQIFPQLLEVAEGLSDEELNDPRRFAGMPEEWSPWELVASNSYTHYPDHIASIRAWLER
jgi:uncharacterized damage-inducible protein DinB